MIAELVYEWYGYIALVIIVLVIAGFMWLWTQ